MMNARAKRKEHGVTLIELLVAGAIGAMLLTTLTVSAGAFLDNHAATLDAQDLALAHHIALERILKSISTAADVSVPSATDLSSAFADGGAETFSWSGTPGAPLMFARDEEAGSPLADGIVALSFSANSANVVEETVEVREEELLRFTKFNDWFQMWEDFVIDDSAMHGFTFNVLYGAEVEQIVLKTVNVRIARLAGQTAALRVSLYEGQSEVRPRIFGARIAEHVVSNGSIPAGSYDHGERQIGKMTIDLPETFVIHPNRYYCLLFSSNGGAGQQAGYLRAAHLLLGYGPTNKMAYLGTADGGATWQPALGTSAYLQIDVPCALEGEVSVIVKSFVPKTDSVDVTLGMAIGNATVAGKGRAYVRGGGDLRYN